MKKILLVSCFLLLGLSAYAADKKLSLAKVRIYTTLQLNDTIETTGKFEGISPGARKLGLGESLLEGTVNYTDLGQDKTRVVITWHTIKYTAGNFTENEPLSPRLFSKFITDANVDPNTSVSVKGDLAKVLESFKSAKKKAEDKTKNNFTTNSVANDTAEDQKVSDLSPQAASSGTSSGGSSAGSTGSTNGSGTTTSPTPNAALQSTEKEACENRIDETAGFVFAQEKEIKSADGKVLSEGACKDSGIKAAIKTTNSGCGYSVIDSKLYLEKRKFATLAGSDINVQDCILDTATAEPTTPKRLNCGVLPNLDANEVYFMFKQVGVVEGRDVEVSECEANLDEKAAIQRTFIGCDVRHDFIQNLTIQQEKTSYLESGISKPLNNAQCGDSSTTYAHYLTEQTCDVITDTSTNKVIIQKRVAYQDNNQQVNYASACKPVSDSDFNIIEEACEDLERYEHDAANNVSYLHTRTYFDHPDGKRFLTDCARSSTVSYEHKFSTDSCPILNDDSARKSTHQSKRYIETATNLDGDLFLEDCLSNSAPVSYAKTHSSAERLQASYTPITNIYFNYDYIRKYNDYFTQGIAFKSGYEIQYKAQIPGTFRYISGGQWATYPDRTFPNGNPDFRTVCFQSGIFKHYRAMSGGEYKVYDRYLRGDGSAYEVHLKYRYKLVFGCTI